VIPQAVKRMLGLRQSYKRVFSGDDGKRVLTDLIRKYIMADPCRENADVTLINLGKQRLAVEIISKVYGNDEDLRQALERANEQQNNQSE
jgi:hypothetical protein